MLANRVTMGRGLAAGAIQMGPVRRRADVPAEQ